MGKLEGGITHGLNWNGDGPEAVIPIIRDIKLIKDNHNVSDTIMEMVESLFRNKENKEENPSSPNPGS